MRAAAVLLLLCGSCGVPGPTPNIGLVGEWSVSDTDWAIDFSLVAGRNGVEGAGQGEADSVVPPFTIAAPEWGHMTWTFGDGRTIEYRIEPGPEQVCPGDPKNVLGAFTVSTMTIHRLGGSYPVRAADELQYSRTPPVQFECGGPTGQH